MPFGLGETPAIAQVIRLYERSFFSLRRLPVPKTMAPETEFCKKLDELMVEHNQVQALVARGLQELHVRRRGAQDSGAMDAHFDFGEFLDRFYLSRVGMRLLSGQHIMLHRPRARQSCIALRSGNPRRRAEPPPARSHTLPPFFAPTPLLRPPPPFFASPLSPTLSRSHSLALSS